MERLVEDGISVIHNLFHVLTGSLYQWNQWNNRFEGPGWNQLDLKIQVGIGNGTLGVTASQEKL